MMETTERIVEAYVRYVRGWATIANIRCAGQNEIDLIAINPVTLDRYHIEVSISISQGFRKLTGKPFDPEKVKQRGQQASQRRTVGFFAKRKFNAPTVIERLQSMGFKPGCYAKVIVTWGWAEDAAMQAADLDIQLWDFRSIIREVAEKIRGSREYFADDTLRTLNLFIHADDEASRGIVLPPVASVTAPQAEQTDEDDEDFWLYVNQTHDYATIHRASCSFCNDGRGMHRATSTANSHWLGPFDTVSAAGARAAQTKRQDLRRCSVCAPPTTK